MRQDWSWQTLPNDTQWNGTTLLLLNKRMKQLEQHLKYLGNLVAGVRVGRDGDATPSVSGIRVWVTGNTGATTVTQFTNGEPGQLLVVVAEDANTTVQHNANIVLASGADWTPTVGKTKLFESVDGVIFREVPT